MDLNVWLTYLAAIWLIALSPGSGAVLSMSHGLAYGVRQTTATIIGLEIGLTIILLVAGVGVGALLLASATAFTIVKLLGTAYLIWIGLKQWRTPVHDGPPINGTRLARARPGWRQRVATGMLTNATNPKGIVFMVAVLPQFIDPQRPLTQQLLTLLLTTIVVDAIVMHGYAFIAARLSRWMQSASARRAQNRLFGGVLMAMGISLLAVNRQLPKTL